MGTSSILVKEGYLKIVNFGEEVTFRALIFGESEGLLQSANFREDGKPIALLLLKSAIFLENRKVYSLTF